MEPDDTLCYCFHISRRKIINYIKRVRPRRASQISDCFGAGSGCGWCVPFLVRLHEEIVGEEAVERDDISPEQYEALRRHYLSEVKEGRREPNQHGEGHGGSSAGDPFDFEP